MKYSHLLLLLAAFVTLSCNKGEGDSADRLSVNPESLQCSFSDRKATIEISCSSSWTLNVADEKGAKVTWLTASAVHGVGDASVTLNLQANPMSSSRAAIVKIVTPSGLSASVGVTQTGDPSSTLSADSMPIRIGSYNVRVSTGDNSDPNNNWTKRRPRLVQSIRDNAFDVFGLQECTTAFQNDIRTDLGDTYEFWFFSPYAQNGVGNKAQGIGWLKDEFTISDQHYFWNCDTPDVMTPNDVCSEATYNRGGSCAVLTHRKTGLKLFFMVTHAALNDDAVVKYAHVFKDMERRWNTKDYPCVFVGDMNAQAENASSATYREHWKDVYLNLPADKISGPYGTFNDFDTSKDMDKGKRIDFIYYRGAIEPVDYVCNTKKYDGFYASDHLPVYSNMIISAK